MILVVVGTHTQSFERLVRAADELAALTDENIIIQYGSSAYRPQQATGIDWVSQAEMDQLMLDARIVLSHAGAGTIISALRMGKPIILAPRLKRYGENHNDHQIQLAEALHAQGKAVVIQKLSGESLRSALEEASGLEPQIQASPTLVKAVSQQLQAWSNQGSKA